MSGANLKRGLEWSALPREAQVYVAAVVIAGAVAFAGLAPFVPDRPWLFLGILAFGLVTSSWKVNLPAAFGSGSTLSVSYSADLMALLLLGPGPATIVALAGVWIQCTRSPKWPYPIYRSVFSTAAEAVTMRLTAATYFALGGTQTLPAGFADLARPLVGAIVVYYLANTGLVAGAMALSTRRSWYTVWRENFLWSAPSFMAAGSAGAFAALLIARGDEAMAVVLAAPVYLTYRTYHVFHDSLRALKQAQDADNALAAEKERLGVVLHSVADGVIAADLQNRVTLMNPAAEAFTGWKQSDAFGRPFAEVYAPRDPDTHAVFDPPVVGTTDPNLTMTSRRATLVATNGKSRPIEDVFAPLCDTEGRTIGIVVAFRDMTDSLRAQEEQERSGRLSSLGVLAGGIAHDFNNILAAIMGNVSLVRLHVGGDRDADEALDEAEQACVRARQLTQQLLTFARGGAPVKKPQRIDLLLRESTKLALSGSNVRPIEKIDPALWAVDADEGQLVQVFHNLLLNARQAMPDGGHVEIVAQNFPEPEARWEFGVLIKAGPYVRISIIDHGTGIPDEVLGRIFEPYFSTKPKGSGLGLATAYSIVKNHGGFLAVESSVGRGTSVHVRLPALLSATVESAPRLESAPAVCRGRVLVMDDEAAVRRVTGKMLSTLGYECETVSAGELAIDRYKEARTEGQPFDYVILDLTIPGGMGGKDVIRELVKIDPSVKAVVASGYAHDDVMANFRAHGFKAMVSKPFTMQELRQALHEVAVLR